MTSSIPQEQLDLLQQAATRDLRTAYTAFKDEVGETIYGFGLYADQAFRVFSLVWFTEEALGRGNEATMRAGHNFSLERWNPAESGYLEWGWRRGFLDETRAAVAEMAPDSPDDAIATADDHARRDALVQAYLTLDAEGLFTEPHGRITLSFWRGDISDEERMTLVGLVNPPEIVARYKSAIGADYLR